MPESAIFAIAMRDFAKDFKPPFRETRLLGHAPSQNANRASRQNPTTTVTAP